MANGVNYAGPPGPPPSGGSLPVPIQPNSSRGLLRIVTPAQVSESRALADNAYRANQTSPSVAMTGLASFIRERWQTFHNHRSTSRLDQRLMNAQRMINGEYEPSKLAEIRKFGGSDVYARIVATKCRGATSLLRSIYLGAERPWTVKPTPVPGLPGDMLADIQMLVAAEVGELQSMGMPVTEQQIMERVKQLQQIAQMAAKKQAALRASDSQARLDDMLVEGGFYRAIADMLVDLPIFPYACIKGPVVRIVPDVRWQNGQATVIQTPKMFWNRVAPADVYWDPGVSDIEDGAIIEKCKVSRSDLNECLGLPGYDDEAIRKVLDEYGRGGLVDWLASTDAQRAVVEGRENPHFNQSHMIDMVEFHGPVQGRMLLEQGFDPRLVGDPIRDVFVQAWLIGRYVIKVQLTPSPRKRHPYYITSFEKVPGTVAGNGLPDILEDIQNVANAALRSMVNNLSIASGPQVVVDLTRMSPLENPDELYPWKRWKTIADPSMTSAAVPPVAFFQPQSHAQELLGVYKELSNLADEISAIPRYSMGTDRVGGPGRTASGLSMLMANASKILQTVAANVDRDIMEPLLQYLYDILMMTDAGKTIGGDEAIEVRGVSEAAAKEIEKAQALQFLQITGNPIDIGITGPDGRASVLRKLAKDLNLPEEAVPDPDVIQARMQAGQAQGGAPGAPSAPGGPGAPAGGGGGGGGSPPAGAPAPTPGGGGGGPRLDLAQQPASGGGGQAPAMQV